MNCGWTGLFSDTCPPVSPPHPQAQQGLARLNGWPVEARREVVVEDPETSGTAVAARIVVQHVRERRDSCVLRTIAAPAPHVLAGATGGSRTQPRSVKNPLARAGPHLKLQVVHRFAAAR